MAVPAGTIEIELSIVELDDVLRGAGGLAGSLRRLDSRAWCNPARTCSVQARAWTEAGFRVERLTQVGVVFRRS